MIFGPGVVLDKHAANLVETCYPRRSGSRPRLSTQEAAPMIDGLERIITDCPPERRRRIAIHVLLWSVILMVANVTLYVTHIIDEAALILVTLVLSWLSLTITAADLVSTTDVRANEDT